MNIVKTINPFRLQDRVIQTQCQELAQEIARSPGIESVLPIIQMRGNELGELIGRDWRIDALMFAQYAATHQYGNVSVLGKSLDQRIQRIPRSSPMYAAAQAIRLKINLTMREMAPVLGQWDKSAAKIQKEMARIVQARKAEDEPIDQKSLLAEAKRSVKGMRPLDWLIVNLDELNQALASREISEVKIAIGHLLQIKAAMDTQQKEGLSMPSTDQLYETCLARIREVDPNGVIQHQLTTWSGWARSLAQETAAAAIPIALIIGTILVMSKVDNGIRALAGVVLGPEIAGAILTATLAFGLFRTIQAKNVLASGMLGCFLYAHVTQR